MREVPPPDLSPLDEFGAFIVEHLHDAGIECGDTLLSGLSRAPGHVSLQAALSSFDPRQRETARLLVSEVVRSAMHDFLFALQEQADFENHISLTVRGTDVVAASDGIHGEAYGPDGWFARFSTASSNSAG